METRNRIDRTTAKKKKNTPEYLAQKKGLK